MLSLPDNHLCCVGHLRYYTLDGLHIILLKLANPMNLLLSKLVINRIYSESEISSIFNSFTRLLYCNWASTIYWSSEMFY